MIGEAGEGHSREDCRKPSRRSCFTLDGVETAGDDVRRSVGRKRIEETDRDAAIQFVFHACRTATDFELQLRQKVIHVSCFRNRAVSAFCH